MKNSYILISLIQLLLVSSCSCPNINITKIESGHAISDPLNFHNNCNNYINLPDILDCDNIKVTIKDPKSQQMSENLLVEIGYFDGSQMKYFDKNKIQWKEKGNYYELYEDKKLLPQKAHLLDRVIVTGKNYPGTEYVVELSAEGRNDVKIKNFWATVSSEYKRKKKDYKFIPFDVLAPHVSSPPLNKDDGGL